MEQVNVHHTWHNRAWYRTPVLRALREHTLAKTVLYIPPHNSLHANVPPPPKPSPELAINAITLLDNLRGRGMTNPVDVHLAMAEHFLGQDNHLAQRIGHNLIKQTGYIIEGLPCETQYQR